MVCAFALSVSAEPKKATIVTFDAPGAGTGSGANHGFLRAKSGTITKFDAPGAGTASGQGTIPILNNPANAIIGFYIDANGVDHGFLRIP